MSTVNAAVGHLCLLWLFVPVFHSIDLFPVRHKVAHDDRSSNFQVLLFNKSTTDMAQILQSHSYEECSIMLTKFTRFGLFILILGISAIVDYVACCYFVTTWEIGLYSFFKPIVFLQKLYTTILRNWHIAPRIQSKLQSCLYKHLTARSTLE